MTLRSNKKFLCTLAVVWLASSVSYAVTVSPEEQATAKSWVAARFGEKPTEALPFTFTFGGQPAAEMLPGWTAARTSRKLDDARTEHTLTWKDGKSGAVVRCVAIEYLDFPTVEWTLYFKNEGQADSPIFADIRALNLDLKREGKSEFLLHHAVGSPCSAADYAPLETPLGPSAAKHLGAAGGRPTNTDMCYFNVQQGARGLIIALGWPGQWAGDFTRDGGENLRVVLGQELTHFKLLPGEEVRGPLVALQFWAGDYIRSQNIWRRWMIAHNVPRMSGKLPPPLFFGCSSRAYEEMIKADEASQIMFIDRYLEEGLKIDYWWMDAGWYVNKSGWPNTGTWEVDLQRFPKGLRPISDHAHQKGLKTLVWFEPERVTPGTWLYEKHPEWLLGKDGEQKLLNLGNDEARKWLIEHVDGLLVEQGIGLYRQDFNMDPLGYWRANDAPDRQGITEIKHVTGYLAYWDALRQRHPDMLIDTCASGGRRNDLETLRRAVPLWRSDYAFEATGHQSMTYGISLWIPYHGTGTVACANAPYYGAGATPVQPYAFWSNIAPGLNCGIDMRVKEIDYSAFRKLYEAWRQISPCYYGDFYPLTACGLDNAQWIAWQFNRSEQGDGFVQAFRRPDSFYRSAQFVLQGLDPAKNYTLKALDTGNTTTMKGSDLMGSGLSVEISERPGAAVFSYQAQ